MPDATRAQGPPSSAASRLPVLELGSSLRGGDSGEPAWPAPSTPRDTGGVTWAFEAPLRLEGEGPGKLHPSALI